jgi:PAS domain S-box-containing protein
MVGTSIMRLIPDDRHDDEEQILGKIKDGKSLQHFETMRLTKDGRLIHVSVTASPVRSAHGEIIGVSKIARDITARKHAEDILRRNADMMAALIAQVPVGVYVVDDKFRLRQVNPKAQPVFADIHPHIGRDFAEVVHVLWPKKLADQIIKRFRHTLKTGEPYPVAELAGKRHDLRVKKIYEWSLQRITLPGGEHSVVCFFEDITERREAELALRRLAVLTALNHKMERELVRRQVVATALETSQQTTYELLIKSRQQQEELRDLSHRLLTAHEEERKRISRELHDVIAQTLTGINLQLASLQAHPAASSSDLSEKIARTQQLVAQSVDTVHRFARDLRPSMLDDLGIIPALRTFSQDFMKRTGLVVELNADTGVEKLDSAARTVLYRIAQEALTNVSRHAKATCAEINIQKRTGSICMEIKDNGRGFDASDTTKSTRLGVLGMRERIEMIGGTFSIESAPGQPTTVRVEIPTDKTKTLKPRS